MKRRTCPQKNPKATQNKATDHGEKPDSTDASNSTDYTDVKATNSIFKRTERVLRRTRMQSKVWGRGPKMMHTKKRIPLNKGTQPWNQAVSR